MSSSTKNDVIEELKTQELTTVLDRKPTALDVERWEEEVAEMAATIKNTIIPGGDTHGFLAVVIPEEEYQLEIEDPDYEYTEPSDPGSYPDIEGEVDDTERRRLEAEHRQEVIDYQKYLGLTEHVRRQFMKCMDPVWLEAKKKPRLGYAGITIKEFFKHLRDDVAQLDTEEQDEMKQRVKIEWDRTKDIRMFFKAMEDAQYQAEKWDVTIDQQDMVNHAVIQMKRSNVFEIPFLRKWEEKPKHEKSWNNMTNYFTNEYRLVQQYQKSQTKKAFESANQMQEDTEITDFIEEFRRDAMVGSEQINQMAQAFTGAATTAKEVMARLKEANETIESQNKTIAQLTNTNKQLTENNQRLTEALAKLGESGGRNRRPRKPNTNAEGEACNICGKIHGKPFVDHCWELEKNKSKRPAEWKSAM